MLWHILISITFYSLCVYLSNEELTDICNLTFSIDLNSFISLEKWDILQSLKNEFFELFIPLLNSDKS